MARDLHIKVTKEKPFFFISYNSEDEKRVTEYVQRLEKHGLPMWCDRGIKTGSEWEENYD